ncbi:hypothetical protein Tco_0037972 [Tanacetum coccineum]
MSLTTYSYADHVGCQDNRRSTSGSTQFLGDKLVSWSSKKQKGTAISSTKAEYIALHGAKHIDVRYHFIKEQVENGIVEHYFVRTEYQLADIFTTPLPRERFNFLIKKLGMRSMSLETLKRLIKEENDSTKYSHSSINFPLMLAVETVSSSTYSDADHAGCQDNRRSTSGSTQFLGDKLVSWSSKKQKGTAISSTKAEYIALHGAIALCCNNVQNSRAKHIDVRYYFIKENVENGIVELYFVRTEYQLADIFTKHLPRERFNFLIEKLGMRSMSPETLKRLIKKENDGEEDDDDEDDTEDDDDNDDNDDDDDNDGNDDDDIDHERTESNRDENPNLNQSNEEQEEDGEEYVDEFTDKEDDDDNANEEYEEELDDAEELFEQEEEDAHVTLTTLRKKLLNFENISPADNEIASLMDTTVRYENVSPADNEIASLMIHMVKSLSQQDLLKAPPALNISHQESLPMQRSKVIQLITRECDRIKSLTRVTMINLRSKVCPCRGAKSYEAASKSDWYKKPEQPPTPNLDWNKRQHVDFRPSQTWISNIARAEEPRTSFDELMDTPIDLSAFVINRLNITNLTQELLVGPAFNILKGTCKSCTELEYHFDECFKPTTERLD